VRTFQDRVFQASQVFFLWEWLPQILNLHADEALPRVACNADREGLCGCNMLSPWL
jgi:hypothetical protein